MDTPAGMNVTISSVAKMKFIIAITALLVSMLIPFGSSTLIKGTVRSTNRARYNAHYHAWINWSYHVSIKPLSAYYLKV